MNAVFEEIFVINSYDENNGIYATFFGRGTRPKKVAKIPYSLYYSYFMIAKMN
jgi:hypothetical protein